MNKALSTAFRRAELTLPRILTLAMTDDCNLACSHCWVEARPQAVPVRVAALDMRRVLDEFAELGGEGIRLTGGEPLLHPDWLAVMEFASSLGFKQVELQTNAMLFCEDDVSALAKMAQPGLGIQISLDGATAQTHDLVRGSGAFDGTMEKLRMLVSAGLQDQVSLFFTEMEHNLADFPAVLALAEDLGLNSVASGTLITGGRAAGLSGLMPPTPQQYSALLDDYRTNTRFRELYAAMGTMAALEWWLADSAGESCCSLAENPYLTPQGKLYPCSLCHHDDFAVAGVYDRSLAEALLEGVSRWSALQACASLRAETIPKCAACPEKSLCAGGCVGRAWGSCADLMAPDDRCEIRRQIGLEASFKK